MAVPLAYTGITAGGSSRRRSHWSDLRTHDRHPHMRGLALQDLRELLATPLPTKPTRTRLLARAIALLERIDSKHGRCRSDVVDEDVQVRAG